MSKSILQNKPVTKYWALGAFLCTFCFHTFSFAPFDIPELAYLVPVPAFLWLFYQQPSRKQLTRVVGAAFWLSWLVLIIWLRHVTWVGWFFLSTILALFPWVWAMAVWWAVPRFKDGSAFMRILGMLGVCSVWSLLEFVRSIFLSGFPWLPLAASQWDRPLTLQLASLTGSYGVSFLLLFVGMTIAFYLRHLFKGKRKGWIHLCPEFLVGMAVWIFFTLGLFQMRFERGVRETFFKAALIQPNVPQNEKWDSSKAADIMNNIRDQLLYQKRIGADIAVLPEAVLPYAIIGDPAMQNWAEELTNDFGGPLLMGALAAEGATLSDDPWYNCFMALYPESGLDRPYYKKRKRVPFGEYIPFRNFLFFLEKFVPIGGDIFPGKSSSPLRLQLESGELPVGALICYEDIFPSLARKTVLNGARALFVVTNDAWYGEEGAAYQHAAHSVLRAVETARPVVRVGNNGWSGWIDEFGGWGEWIDENNVRQPERVMKSPDGSIYYGGSKIFEVTYNPKTYRNLTFYVVYGNWFLWVCLVIIGLLYYLLRRDVTHVSEDDEWDSIKDLKISPTGSEDS